MPATLVFDSRTVPALLTTPGFEGTEIKPPPLAVERAVAAVLACPSERQARWFVSTLLVGCMTPRRTISEIEALSEAERSRLRRAVIQICDEGTRWRSLYGSHLSADERLLAVMVWRHRRQRREVEGLITRIAARRAELRARPADASGVDLVSSELAARLSGMLTLTTQAQRAATLYNGLVQPYAKSANLVHSAYMGSAYSKIRFDHELFGIGKSLDRTRRLLKVASEPSWMKALRGARLGMEDTPWMKALTSVGVGIDITASVRAIAPVMPSAFAIVESITRKLRPSEEVLRFYEEVDQFMQDWEADALWLLFQHIDIGSVRGLMRLSKADVREVVLVALETVCSDGKYVAALRAAVSKAPYLTSAQRIHLDHALEHAETGEYVKASAPLYPGLEGAYREAAYATDVLARPTSSKKAPGLVTIVKLMPVPAELKTFMRRAVFSGSGHTIRHGSADGVERRQVLLGVVALAAWLERFATDSRALDVLASRLSETLPHAAKQVQSAPPERVVGGRAMCSAARR